MLGAVMFITKYLMEALPGVHLLGLFIAAFTLTYRVKALIPIYVYVIIDGVVHGFSMWWVPYLYIWALLWGMVMLVSKIKMPQKAKALVYMAVCGLHGLAFGILYAPAQAVMFGLTYKLMIAWIIAGLPFDAIHGLSNFCMASLVLPLHALLKKLNKITG